MRVARGVVAAALAVSCAVSTPPFPSDGVGGIAPERHGVPGVRVPVDLTTHTANDYQPAISPDGTRLLFVSDRQGQPDLWLKSIDGRATRGAVRVTWHTATDAEPAWAPNGRTIVFTSHREDPDGDIYTIRTLPLIRRLVGDRLLWRRGSIVERLTDSSGAESIDSISPSWPAPRKDPPRPVPSSPKSMSVSTMCPPAEAPR